MLTVRWRPLAAFLLTLLAVTLCACGGGSSVTPDPGSGDNPGGNNPGGNTGGNDPGRTTSLAGQLRQDPLAQVAATPGASMSGTTVSVLDAASGAVQATTKASVDGSFQFNNLPAGAHMLRLNFKGRVDGDGDGQPDRIELLQKVNLQAGKANVFNSMISDVDEDSDGESDAYEMHCSFSDGSGNTEDRLLRLLHRLLKLLEDRDGDGSLIDEQPVDDADGDCMADKPTGDWNGGTHGGVIRGEISAIDDTSITVNDISFSITDATRWIARGHEDGGAPRFDVGDEVRVRGMWTGDEWIALEVKLKQNNGNGGGGPGHGGDQGESVRFGGEISEIGDGTLQVGGHSVLFDDHTRWFIEQNRVDGVDSFSVGDFVFVKGKQSDEGVLAQKVILISHGDGGGDNGGGGGGGPTTETVDGVVDFIDEASISVDSRVISLTDATELIINGESSDEWTPVTAGDLVEVEAQVQDEIWTATKVTLVEDRDAPPDTETVTGVIESLSLDSITVDGQVFGVTETTDIVLGDGSAGTLADLQLGQTVEVQAVADGDAWNATRITVQTDPGSGGGGDGGGVI